jgi:putative membrane protein
MLSTLIADCYGRGYGWGPGPWLFPFFFVVPLALAFLFFRFWPGRFGRFARSASFDARSALATRYAQGEMDEDEYRRRLAVLEESGR